MSSSAEPIRPWRLRWVCLAIWALGAFVLFTPLNEKLSRPWVDLQLRSWAVPGPIPGVTVIDIDEASLLALQKDLGNWPYRRDVYAIAIDELRRAGVRAIALDVLLTEEREGDAALAREIMRPGAPVVLPATALGQPETPSAQRTADMAWPQWALPATSILPPHERAGRVGVVTLPLDSDGYLRRWPLWHEAAGQRWPALPLALWQATHRTDAQSWPPKGKVGTTTIPIGESAGAVARLPFSVLMGAALERTPRQALTDRVRDRVVIIGAGALQADIVLSPGGPINGAEALAQAYAALEERRLVKLPEPRVDMAITVLAGLPLLLAAMRGSSSLRQTLSMVAWAAASILAVLAAASWGLHQLTQPAAAGVVLMASVLCLAAWRQRELKHTQALLIEERRLADQSSKAKSEFLAKVSHEIRTPMNAVLGAAELLSRKRLAPDEQELVGLFTDAGHRLQTLLDDMLDLSRIEAGRLELHAAPFSLHDMLTRVTALVRLRAERKGLSLIVHRADDLPEGVLGDTPRLEQILLNLLSNAVTFTDHGSVTLSVQRSGPSICFVVTDTGIGIAPNKLALIFEPFTQADGSMSRHYGGSGLGLSIVRQLAQLMGGDIQANSEPGHGSRFELRVPLPPTPLAGGTAPVEERARSLVGLRVLLVEDNDVNVIIFQAMLQSLGLQADVAVNGVEGFERLRAQSCDLAFVDIQMPVMDGLTMTRLFRQEEASQPGRRRIPLIALTANAYATDARLSREAGCDYHISKPYTRQQLLEALGRFAPDDLSQRVAPPPASPAPALPVSSASWGSLDRDAARASLGSQALYDAACGHARVFISGWEADFLLARRQAQRDRQQALAHDLGSILTTVGATALADKAADLERLLLQPSPEESKVDSALGDLLQHLPTVLLALNDG